jgi:hypothetical protein
VPRDQQHERQMIEALCRQLDSILDASDAAPGCRTIAAIITAARYARRSALPSLVAGAMLADYIVKGDPL